VREARFPFSLTNSAIPTRSTNGGVEDLFTVSRPADAGSAAQHAAALILRADKRHHLPHSTPVFGHGTDGKHGTTQPYWPIARPSSFYGWGSAVPSITTATMALSAVLCWKAQNKSLLMFAGEAYNVEMGISNDCLRQDRPLPGEDHFGRGLSRQLPEPRSGRLPRDITHSMVPSASSVTSDTALSLSFMQFLDQPTPPLPRREEQPRSLMAAGSLAPRLCHLPYTVR